MTAPAAVPRGTPRPVTSLDDVLLELVDLGDNVRADPGDLDELAASIAELGVLEPVKVTAQPDGRYLLVFGQRRVLASRIAGKTRIPAIIEPAGDIDTKGGRRSIEQLAENLVRKDLNPIEEAVALREVLDATKGLTQAALAKQLGVSAPWVSNTLRLLDTAPEVQTLVRDEKLSAAHAKVIAGIDVDLQADFAERVVEHGYSAHETERQAKYRQDDAKRIRDSRAAAERRAKEAIIVLEKVANRKTAHLAVADYGGSGGAVSALLTADGWTVAKDGFNTVAIDQAGSCGCDGVWRIEIPYNKDKIALKPGCSSDEHKAARKVEREAEWERTRAAADIERAADAAARQPRLLALAGHIATSPADPLSLRLVLYALLEDDYDHDLVTRFLTEQETDQDGDFDQLWAAIERVPDVEVGAELGKAVAASILNEYNLSASVIAAAEAGIPAMAPPEPAPKATKPSVRKPDKANRAPFTASQAAAAVAEMDAEGLT